MRLFTAIDLPDEMRLRLERLLAVLRGEAMVKWSPLDNLHITMKFIGSWPDDRCGEIEAALGDVDLPAPFPIELQGLDWFPNPRFPRVLVLGVKGGEPLTDLARRMDERLARLGVRREEREYSPHLTLARIKTPTPLTRLQARSAEMQPAAVGTFIARAFYLYRSDQGPTSSHYRKLREYRFENALAATGS
jgi:2'-5' RNA ligase